ncbi:unnamed protein product [Diatraea saccharalis]|uniref:Uncharacterized protein n=1 Tax=Diatraea saccharalis TaxID=40085 RepID=A0A9N9QZY1_9NEOP|nr:unnamed protein product [Diatraea saccharalis]
MERRDIIFYFGDSTTNRIRLFQDALSCAKFGKVLFILYEEIQELPQLSQDFSLISKQYMKMISFVYAKTINSLLGILSSLHEWQNIPSTIILDDITKFCCKEEIQKACGIVAFIIDTVRNCSRVSNLQCKLRISIDEEAGDDFYNNLREVHCVL